MMWAMVAVVLGVMFVLWLGIYLGRWIGYRSRTQTDAEKRKRGLDGLDMYSLIDRLVEDLDDNELSYLRRRIEDRETGPQPLPEAMETLLKQRTDDRDAGRR